ncbi:MAG: hypothetical protein KJ579_02710 [Verrucomicrobia bacterium]|nr:hypothetical protein [Verrucomicrobiota bacterium]
MKPPAALWGAILAACTAFAADAPPPRSVWLTYARREPTHVTVSWWTDVPCASSVAYGATEACGKRAAAAGTSSLHHVEIPLPAAGPFHYRIESPGGRTAAFQFAGLPGDELRVAMMADWGYATGNVATVLRDDIHLLTSGGDHVPRLHAPGVVGEAATTNLRPHLALLAAWPALFRHVPFMPALGNHDREIRSRASTGGANEPVYDIGATAYRTIFPLPDDEWTWRFELPAFGVRLIGLDLNHTRDIGTRLQSCHDVDEGSEQLAWYRRVMEGPAPRFTLTIHNEHSSVIRTRARGEWGRLFRRGTLSATGDGYFAERAETDGFPWFNTSLNGIGDVYKDSSSKFLASENNYLLFRFRKGARTMRVEIKRLEDGAVLDASEWPK